MNGSSVTGQLWVILDSTINNGQVDMSNNIETGMETKNKVGFDTGARRPCTALPVELALLIDKSGIHEARCASAAPDLSTAKDRISIGCSGLLYCSAFFRIQSEAMSRGEFCSVVS